MFEQCSPESEAWACVTAGLQILGHVAVLAENVRDES